MSNDGARIDRWAQFRGLSWWQLILSFGPLALAAFGGLVGGLFGALAMVINLKIARGSLSTPLKALIMLVVAGVAVVLYVVVASIILEAVR